MLCCVLLPIHGSGMGILGPRYVYYGSEGVYLCSRGLRELSEVRYR